MDNWIFSQKIVLLYLQTLNFDINNAWRIQNSFSITCKHIYHVIEEEFSFTEEQSNSRIVYTDLKPHIVKPQTVLDKHDYMSMHKFIRSLRKESEIIPIIKYLLIGIAICLPFVIGYTFYQRLWKNYILNIYWCISV